ncbi:MAG: AAA family ATPase [Candidatus Eisenbacteria bacterium]|uniref:AAA family ATPase n=1 Tax=Eiseniibacteriota bacterium TaxID=2212470 RepID=A0A937XAY3_UNCEI|nr:AAA family ATPase [Candidatus Eisenbacteria bacterium]
MDFASAVARSRAEVEEAAPPIRAVIDEVGRVIVGRPDLLRRLLVGLLADGHILLEGVPGLAKTLAVRSLASAVRARFSRIQFTPDLLPADLTGTMIYDPRSGSFTPRQGPLFAHIVLADEINRAPAKVQSALLEAMQERQITIGETTHRLEEPFLVLATQNPIEHEGTYPLPEAQVDRFLLKVRVGYPERLEEHRGMEMQILERMTGETLPETRPLIEREAILAARRVVRRIPMAQSVKDYIVDLVLATREPERMHPALKGLRELIAYGASPRATLALAMAGRAMAFLSGRGSVYGEDIKEVALDVLRHRVLITYEAEARNVSSEEIVRQILDQMRAP